ncbi:MAG: hypothetical protein AAFY22_11935 [Pseudomonadota bacterium]
MPTAAGRQRQGRFSTGNGAQDRRSGGAAEDLFSQFHGLTPATVANGHNCPGGGDADGGSPYMPRYGGDDKRGAVMTAIALILAFVIFLAALNFLEKGRVD